MTESELVTFKAMFKSYHEFLINKKREDPPSILARIYGIFTVQMEDILPIHLILMGNTIQSHNPS